jgi:hypothetical protein
VTSFDEPAICDDLEPIPPIYVTIRIWTMDLRKSVSLFESSSAFFLSVILTFHHIPLELWIRKAAKYFNLLVQNLLSIFLFIFLSKSLSVN